MATRIAGFVLVIGAVCLLDNSHGQPLVPVHDFEELDATKQLVWTLQTVLAPRTLTQVERLYAYDPQDLEGVRVYPERIGNVATIKPCNSGSSETEVAWCAQYFGGDDNAVRRAYGGAVAGDGGACALSDNGQIRCYFATTRPLPEIVPERSFVAGLPQ
ncbi:MAG: hypothetical protein OXH69_03045 [Acidobacteria bacterium]|nr:hypothetical protein [Acidobacteriota bacterium]